MLLGHVRRTLGYLVVSFQSRKCIVIVNKAYVNGGHCQDSVLSWVVAKEPLCAEEVSMSCRPHRRTLGHLVVSFQSPKSIMIVNKASVNGGYRQGLRLMYRQIDCQ